MTKIQAIVVLPLLAILFGTGIGSTEPTREGVNGDTSGILRQPIPEKLVALTFDDGPASGYTVVAPVLKALGFGGSFYVADFDSFRTRKDWYLTWRQMKALTADGFEVGNHTRGHVGGAGIEPFLRLEDEMLANRVPKPTTIAWPVYQVNTRTYPDLAANGYLFGRGGHERPYRPTVDNPFDVPSFSVSDEVGVERFIGYVQHATQGRVVVITFHGVPDMEHPTVGLEPATFKVMMQYLKDNSYRAVALRDLAKYVDPAKAAKLPPTADDARDAFPSAPVKGDKPYFGTGIRAVALPGMPPVRILGSAIRATVPPTTDVTALAPTFKLVDEATIVPASGTPRDFSKPQTYTVTARGGATRIYTVTVNKTAPSAAKEVLTFALPGKASATISGSAIDVSVPPETDVSALAPTFTLSPSAVAVPASGTARDFTKPQTYTVTAQDGSSRVWTVTAVKSDRPTAFVWTGEKAGNWSDASRWSNNRADGSAPVAAGRSDYALDFRTAGALTATNDRDKDFLLNWLRLDGPTVKIDGKGLTFVARATTGTPPRLVQTARGNATIATPLKLDGKLTGDGPAGATVELAGTISGPGSLTKQGDGQLRITNKTNPYRGGTVIDGGSLMVIDADQALGSGPVTLNGTAALDLEKVNATNPLILNGGTINAGNGFGDSWNAPITLNGNTQITCYADFLLNNISGGMSGPGGFTQVGSVGPFGLVNGGTLTLCGANTYSGPTTVRRGTLRVLKAAALYNADPANWTPAKITVAPAAQLRLRAGGSGEFTGAQVGTLLRNLTTGADDNGLMAGAVFGIDTAGASAAVAVAADIADSKGPGGGPFVLKKFGAGTLQLGGNNTYTGQTILDGGALSVASLNSVVNGKPGSSLGAPTTVETGEIVIGSGGGEFALIYTGAGETSDRVLNLAGQKSVVTVDQSGSGILKLTSSFVLSGYGTSKTIVLRGDTTGRGEIAGGVADPYDRAGKATTAVTKSGSGTWTLSGANSYTGPTTVAKGTLALGTAGSLGDKADVRVADGATLALNFKGRMNVRKLSLGGKAQPDGSYSAASCPEFISGAGVLSVQSEKTPPAK
jgi:autotransporter-associated beta strand protein